MKKDGGWSRNRTGVHGVAVRCITTLPSSQFWELVLLCPLKCWFHQVLNHWCRVKRQTQRLTACLTYKLRSNQKAGGVYLSLLDTTCLYPKSCIRGDWVRTLNFFHDRYQSRPSQHDRSAPRAPLAAGKLLSKLTKLERETRFELATPTLARSCSTN